MQHLRHLILERLDHMRVGVANRGHCDPGAKVQQSSPIGVEEVGPFAPHKGMRAFAIGGHQCLGHGIAPLLLQVQEGGEYLGSERLCQQFPQLLLKFAIMDLYQSALAYTARYATSKENLRRVLWRKLRRAAMRNGEEAPDKVTAEAEITSIVKRLESIGAVDDQAYASAQLRMLQAKGTSARAIHAKLSAKGVPKDMIAAILETNTPEEDEKAAAARYAKRRRLGPFRHQDSSPEQRQKDLAALCRAGFPFQIAVAIIDSTYKILNFQEQVTGSNGESGYRHRFAQIRFHRRKSLKLL